MDCKTRVSDCYVATIDLSSEQDLEFLARLRKDIKTINAVSTAKFRVVVRGRKPKVKVNNKGYDYHGNVVGGLKNAKEADIYIYDRS